MIKIFRKDSMSIHIEFDMEGSHIFLKMFNEIMGEKEFKLNVEFDMGVINMRKSEVIKNLIIICCKNNEEESVFTIENGEIMWKMEQEDIEMGIERFTTCEQQGFFSPSEFTRIQIPKNKKLDYIYCELIKK